MREILLYYAAHIPLENAFALAAKLEETAEEQSEINMPYAKLT